MQMTDLRERLPSTQIHHLRVDEPLLIAVTRILYKLDECVHTLDDQFHDGWAHVPRTDRQEVRRARDQVRGCLTL